MDPVENILARHGVRGPFRPLPALGIANRIYATDAVVVRIAVGSAESISDARTESIAAPVARAAGVPTPRLLAFDDTREIVDVPYSLWERIHGETVGVYAQDPRAVPEVWRGVGRELARLHSGVTSCPDPNGWLDEPGSGDPRGALGPLVDAGRLDLATARELEAWLGTLEPALAAAPAPRFLHDDLHEKNLMCDRDGKLLAFLDWGDAGWGDPALDLASVPLAVVPLVWEAYAGEAPGVLGEGARERMLWARADGALGRLMMDARRRGRLDELLQLIRAG